MHCICYSFFRFYKEIHIVYWFTSNIFSWFSLIFCFIIFVYASFWYFFFVSSLLIQQPKPNLMNNGNLQTVEEKEKEWMQQMQWTLKNHAITRTIGLLPENKCNSHRRIHEIRRSNLAETKKKEFRKAKMNEDQAEEEEEQEAVEETTQEKQKKWNRKTTGLKE